MPPASFPAVIDRTARGGEAGGRSGERVGRTQPLPRATSFSWRRWLWGLLLPQRSQRIAATLPGVVLVALAVGIGSAAYNTGSNILFITLSLLLASLVLSGVGSWLNFAHTEWSLRPAPPFRVGQEAGVVIELRNGKRVLASHALWFDVAARLSGLRKRLYLRGRLAPGGGGRLEWTFRPAQRGVETLSLDGVGSLFPFGFLRKTIAAEGGCEVPVWPARIAYRFTGAAPLRHQLLSEEIPRAGGGSDLLGLRRYQPGDSHRQVHWKASARLRQLLVRQNATESAMMFSLQIDTAAALWPQAAQFELLCSLAGTLAEDLFRAGRLDAVAIDDGPPREIQCIRDVETLLDRLAELQPRTGERLAAGRWRATTITFAPEGERGICAWLGDNIAARV